MVIHSWNVNGLRACINKGGFDRIEAYNPDIICIQEVKCSEPFVFLEGYYHYFNLCERANYSGTAVLTKEKPIKDLTRQAEFDTEGRIIVLEYESFILINAYVPNPHRNLSRYKYRLWWNDEFIDLVKVMLTKKPVIIVGDFNTVHDKEDIYDGNKERKVDEFNLNERGIVIELERLGFVDMQRYKFPENTVYSWYSQRRERRSVGRGWRLDFNFISSELKTAARDITYIQSVPGSDHIPVELVIDEVEEAKEKHILSLEWESIDLNKAREELEECSKRIKSYARTRNWEMVRENQEIIFHSQSIRALAIERASKNKPYALIKESSLYNAYEKEALLKQLNFKLFDPHPIYVFEKYHKFHLRKMGKLYKEDYVYHLLLSWMIKPVSEVMADPHSFAFLDGKSPLDAHYLLQDCLNGKFSAGKILYFDIKNFFGSIDHKLLIEHLPVDPKIPKKLLDTKVCQDNFIYESNGKGISLGSPSSGFMANLFLDGMEKELSRHINKEEFMLIRFVDDIILLLRPGVDAVKARNIVKEFLLERKLELNEVKSFVKNTGENFTYMNWDYIYNGSSYHTKPTNKTVEIFKKELKEIIDHSSFTINGLIKKLNQKISGWGNYFRYCESQEVFKEIDKFVDDLLLKKVKKRNKRMSGDEIINAFTVYFYGSRHFCLKENKRIFVKKLSDIPIISYDPCIGRARSTIDTIRINNKYRNIWFKQNGCCTICGERIFPKDKKELIKINGKLNYIHSHCKKRTCLISPTIHDLTTSFQLINAVKVYPSYLLDDYNYPEIMGYYEELRREMHECPDDFISYSVTQTNTATPVADRRVGSRFASAAKKEGFLFRVEGDEVHLRREMSSKIRIEIPDEIKLNELPDEAVSEINDFFELLRCQYGLDI